MSYVVVYQSGAKLKKTVTVDKSVAPNAGAVVGEGGGAKPSSAPAASKPAAAGGLAGQLSAMMGGGGGGGAAPKVLPALLDAVFLCIRLFGRGNAFFS